MALSKLQRRTRIKYRIRKIISGTATKPRLSVYKDSLKLSQINTTKLRKYTNDYVFGKLGFKPKTPITYSHLESGINTLLATENFHSISYSFKNNEQGEDLELQLAENPIYTYLKLGLHYDELFKSGILVNITHKNNLFKNTEEFNNIKNANLDDYVTIKQADFFQSEKEVEGPLHMVFNPPYGERLDIDMERFYREIGDTMKQGYSNTNAWFITANLDALKFVGLRPSRKIKLFNGKLEARFVKYEMYAGSKKGKYMNNDEE